MKILVNKKNNPNEKIIEQSWKNSNQNYILALEKFLDRASNIKEEELRNSIINNMLACDRILTEISEEEFRKIHRNYSVKNA